MKEPLRLRVMTFNIHGGRPRLGPVNLEGTARVIRELQPDLVALQEVHQRMPPPYVWQDQPARLRKLLGMRVVFRRSFGLGPCGYGNAILARPLPVRVVRTRLPGRTEPRTLLEAEFELGGRRFCFFNTHLGLSQEERAEQVQAIARRARQVDLPLIIAGDWNTTPDAPEMEALAQAGMLHLGDGGVPTFPCDAPRVRLDYLFVSREFAVERCEVVETEVSDHLPALATLAVR